MYDTMTILSTYNVMHPTIKTSKFQGDSRHFKDMVNYNEFKF